MQLPDLARRLVAVALAAVDPERLVREALASRQERWGGVLALGKAAPGLARGAAAALAPGTAPRRLLVRTHGAPALLDPAWEQLSGGHPLPDRQSLAAGRRVLRWLAELPAEMPLLVLISGGSSACVEAPAGDLALDELMAVQSALLASGRPIHAFNAVRKHLSALKGGGGLRASPAPVLALLLSDVPGDDPATIGSGPFTADPTTFAEALGAVEDLAVPERVRQRLLAGARGEIEETLKPGDPAAARVTTLLLGSAATAAGAVAGDLRRRGFTAVTGELAGETVAAARSLVRQGREIAGPLAALVLGGETTVTLGAAPGRGGRNQELALAAAQELAGGRGEVVLTLATDGEDGPTRFAGAVVDGASWTALAQGGRDPGAALGRHDSQTALAALPGALLQTGITGTNTGDLAIYLRAEPS
jgi:hydroxypyruvate reductase